MDDGLYMVEMRTLDSDLNLTLSVAILQSQCLYWDDTDELWSDNGCIVLIILL